MTGEGKKLGFEGDHLTTVQKEKLDIFLKPAQSVDIAEKVMRQRMKKSAERNQIDTRRCSNS